MILPMPQVKICKHFAFEELFPRLMIGTMSKEQLRALMDRRILIAADYLRDRFGSCMINDWMFGGTRELCGYRPANCGVGAKNSQHMHGRAIDAHFRDITAYEIRAQMRLDPEQFLAAGITRVEDDVSWLHVDCAATTNSSQIYFFKA